MSGRARIGSSLAVATWLVASVDAQIPPIPANIQRSLERIVGVPGTYVASEEALTIRIPRNDVSLRIRGQAAVPGFPIGSWAAFSVDMHHQALMNGELALLEDEVNPIAGAALDAGLEVTGLANTMLFDQPRVLTMNISAIGEFDKLALGFRKCLDAIAATRSVRAGAPASALKRPPPEKSAIDGGHLDTILSMKGTVTSGVYRAAIGRVTLLNGMPIGREMGASTWVVFAGTNQNATVQAEMVLTGMSSNGS